MRVTRTDFESAAAETSLSDEQRQRLWTALEEKTHEASSFSLETVASYLGALIVICAMGWFGARSWESFGGKGILAIALSYAFCFALAGRHLWFDKGLEVPGGLLVTTAVCMAPLGIYGFEKICGIDVWGLSSQRAGAHWLKESGLFMQLGTVFAALVALRWVRFPFLMAPIAFALWCMAMELSPHLVGKSVVSWDESGRVSVLFGLALVLIGFLVDRVSKEDFAFWLYLFGLLAFQGGVSFQDGDGQLRRAAYCFLAVAFIGVGILLRRRTFLVFAGFGLFSYLSYLSHFFATSLFPLALSLLGIAILFFAIQLRSHHTALLLAVDSLVPARVRRFLPPRRE